MISCYVACCEFDLNNQKWSNKWPTSHSKFSKYRIIRPQSESSCFIAVASWTFGAQNEHFDMLRVTAIITYNFHLFCSFWRRHLLLREASLLLNARFFAFRTLLTVSSHVLEAVSVNFMAAFLSHDHALQLGVDFLLTVRAIDDDSVLMQVPWFIFDANVAVVAVEEVIAASKLADTAQVAMELFEGRIVVVKHALSAKVLSEENLTLSTVLIRGLDCLAVIALNLLHFFIVKLVREPRLLLLFSASHTSCPWKSLRRRSRLFLDSTFPTWLLRQTVNICFRISRRRPQRMRILHIVTDATWPKCLAVFTLDTAFSLVVIAYFGLGGGWHVCFLWVSRAISRARGHLTNGANWVRAIGRANVWVDFYDSWLHVGLIRFWIILYSCSGRYCELTCELWHSVSGKFSVSAHLS